MSVGSIVTNSMNQLIGYLQSIAELNGKVIQVYNVDDLMSNLVGVKYPAGGVLYDGMRSVPEAGAGPTDRKGLSAELIISVLLVMRTESFGPTDQPNQATVLLDTIRDKIKGTNGPSMHKWRFVVEAAAAERKGNILWVQRWALPLQLTN